MKNFTFRQYRRSPKEDPKESASDSKDKDNAAYLKRREQVRRAQRTHRERKEAYIKSLENEVLQLRTNEAKILQETRNLYSEIGRLKRILDHHGIPYGNSGYSLGSLPSDSSTVPSVSSVSILSNPHQQQQIHIRGSQQGSSSQFYLSESDGSQSTEASKAPRKKRSFFRSRGHSTSESNAESSASGQALSVPDISAIAASASNLSLRDMDQTNLGMEFVLTLEAPCLHHTQGDPHEPHTPSGHALTASAPLLFQSATQPVPTASGTRAPQWDTSNLGLEKLLSLSSNIPLTDELTPVQAWNQIRTHPDFESVQVPNLRRLTEDMLKHVKCYGFGAVIETEVFEALARNVLPGFGFDFGAAY